MPDRLALPKISRRGFLKLGAATAAAGIITPHLPSAPLFIPSDRLEMGVPSTRYLRPSVPITSTDRMVTLLRNEFIPWLPPHKFPAGSRIPVPNHIAERWISRNIAMDTAAHPDFTPPPDTYVEKLTRSLPVQRMPVLNTKPSTECIFGTQLTPGHIYATDIDPLPSSARVFTAPSGEELHARLLAEKHAVANKRAEARFRHAILSPSQGSARPSSTRFPLFRGVPDERSESPDHPMS